MATIEIKIDIGEIISEKIKKTLAENSLCSESVAPTMAESDGKSNNMDIGKNLKTLRTKSEITQDVKINNIRAFRIKQGLTQTALAKKLKVTQGTLSFWETGTCYPRADKIPALLGILNCKLTDLIDNQKGT